MPPQSEKLLNFFMPLRWYGNGDSTDPLYLHFSRIVNLTIHFMAFAALNSGLWFFQKINHPWNHLNWLTEIWLLVLTLHLVFVIAKRPTDSDTIQSGQE